MVRLTGRVTRVRRHELSPGDAARLEMPAYTTCTIETAHGTAVAITADVPDVWQRMETLNEPVSISGVFVKRVSQDPPTALFVAERVAWHPTMPQGETVSLGESILGSLGMDVGLLDDVESRGRMRSEESDAFYAVLQAAGNIGANQLARFAQGSLSAVRDYWAAELDHADDASRRALAHEVVRRAAEGRYSVAPLFNDAEHQIGQLVVVEGVVRRVVRVAAVSREDDGTASDIARRFGFDHYYEMEVFTDDSQNYPLIFCVRELPAGFPTGGQLHVPVRVAGFFFKDWLYRTRRTEASMDSAADAGGAGRPQFAPLLIGRGPVFLEPAENESSLARWVGAGFFLLALAGIWAAAWWFARDDRKFDERTRARFSLPEGQSLDELNVPTLDEPMK
jgi:hypothetical protein